MAAPYFPRQDSQIVHAGADLRAVLQQQERPQDLAGLREENEQLRTLVIELSRIVARSVLERK